jgi:hypothetical protein
LSGKLKSLFKIKTYGQPNAHIIMQNCPLESKTQDGGKGHKLEPLLTNNRATDL